MNITGYQDKEQVLVGSEYYKSTRKCEGRKTDTVHVEHDESRIRQFIKLVTGYVPEYRRGRRTKSKLEDHPLANMSSGLFD